jgi:hypothetical protein
MRKTAYLIAATISAATLAVMSFSSVAANASTSAPTAQRTAAVVARPTSLNGQPVCQKVQSAGHASLERCSQLLGVTPAKAGPQSPGTLSLTRRLMTSASGGCVGNGHGDSQCQYSVSPRVTCGGYNGQVWWDNLNFGGASIIGTYGEVWDLCGWTTNVYLYWEQNAGLRKFNDYAGHASNHATVGVNYSDARPAESIGGVSNVSVTVCSNYNNGWHCGTPQHV